MEKQRLMPAEVLPTDTPQLFEVAARRAAELLRAGEVVALPTETVYGLAANALNGEAVGRVFQIKGRPTHNPIIVHVASLAMAHRCAADWPKLADKFSAAFWPGPLTLVVPRASEIPDLVTAGGPTIGVRWPGHPFIQDVIRRCGFPLAAPSANLSNQVSPTTAEHVRKAIGNRVALIVDGGPSHVGIESTVVDISVSPPRLLRPGMIHEHALVAVSGELVRPGGEGGEVLRSPGLLRKHYAPRARLAVLAWHDEQELFERTAETGVPTEKTFVIAHTQIPSGEGLGRVSVIPHDADAFARAIYAELHECDEGGAELIVVEAPPTTADWRAIVDRLRRAAAI